jgi:hypothetical protein
MFYISILALKEAFKQINSLKKGNFDYLSFEAIDSKLTLTTFSSQKNSHRISEARELIKIENIEIETFPEIENNKFCMSFKFLKDLVSITRKGDILFKIFGNVVQIKLQKHFECEIEATHTTLNYFMEKTFYIATSNQEFTYAFDLNLKEVQKQDLSALEVWELVKDLKMENEEQKVEEIYQFQEIPELKDWHTMKPKAQKILLKLVKEKYENDLKYYPNPLAQLIVLDQELIEKKTGNLAKLKNRLNQIMETTDYSQKDCINSTTLYKAKSKFRDEIQKVLSKNYKFKDLFTHVIEERSGLPLNSDLNQILNEIELLFKEFLKSNSIVENQIVLKPQNEFILIDYVQPTQKEIKASKTVLLTGKIKVKRQRVKKIQPKTVIEVKPKKVLSKTDNLTYENKKTIIELPKEKVEKEAKEKENPNQMYFVFENIILFNNMIFRVPRVNTRTPQRIDLNQKYKQYFSLFIVFFLSFSLNLLNIIRQVV